MEDITVNQYFEEMEEIISKMEDKDVPLEEAFMLYQSGMEKLKLCNEKITQVEQKILAINEAGQLEEFKEV